jgi:glycosyltransferase involved in cell wall biosynthesis
MTVLRAAQADIAVLLEGTYPYVSGGVSSWVHQVIRAFPDNTFALVFIGSRRDDYGKMRYELPPNVVHLEEHYIHADAGKAPARPVKGSDESHAKTQALHDYFRSPATHLNGPELVLRMIDRICDGELSEEEFLHGETAWRFLGECYRRFSTEPSFVDYFWTVRIMHKPIWQLARLAATMPKVRVYHSVSTGYAGFLGAVLHHRNRRPLILSEHGIYTKERKIDLFQSQWVRDNREFLTREATEIGYLKNLWIRFFGSLGRMCYAAADPIVALYENNRLRQVADGAEDSRTTNIPNGIDIARFLHVRASRPERPPPVLCLIGRVVPIKDVKTFSRAMRIVANRVPGVEGWIAGPLDEDKGYVEECRNLVDSLGLNDVVKFLGFQKMEEVLAKIGVLVLSSISEGLPLVILEAYACGVPVVSTDVGSCRQLVEGLPGEDAALGRSGRIVGIADPEALAAAMLDLLTDEREWHAAKNSAIARVEKFYTQDMMIGRYREIYLKALAAPDAAED